MLHTESTCYIQREYGGSEACAGNIVPFHDHGDYGEGDEGDTDEALWELWWIGTQPPDVWCSRALCGDMPSYAYAEACAQDDPEAVWALWYDGTQPPDVPDIGDEEGYEGEGVYYDSTLCASSELHSARKGGEDPCIGGIEDL